MEKKIAISTWYSNGNFGGTLQAYALQKTLTDFGYTSEFINLVDETSSKSYKIKRKIKDMAILAYKPKFYISRLKIFKFVRENLEISKPYYTYYELKEIGNEKYLAAICGSDQIWANVGDKIDDLSYLTFICPDRRIAYAPSTGYNKIDKSLEKKFKQYVDEIRFLSVREKQGAEFIKELTGNEAKVVLDPSLLLNKQQWEKEIKKNNNKLGTEKYIFCYFLGDNKDYISYACELSKKTGYKLIGLEAKYLSQRGIKKVTAGPIEFLNYINNASYVLTDSFHGVCFSINLGKEFTVFKRFKDDDPKNQNSRIINILEKVGLEDRFISPTDSVDKLIKNKIEHNNVQIVLDRERCKSLTYLKSSIENVLRK